MEGAPLPVDFQFSPEVGKAQGCIHLTGSPRTMSGEAKGPRKAPGEADAICRKVTVEGECLAQTQSPSEEEGWLLSPTPCGSPPCRAPGATGH